MTLKNNSNRIGKQNTAVDPDSLRPDALLTVPAQEWWHVKSVFDQLIVCGFDGSARNVNKLKNLTLSAYNYYEGKKK